MINKIRHILIKNAIISDSVYSRSTCWWLTISLAICLVCKNELTVQRYKLTNHHAQAGVLSTSHAVLSAWNSLADDLRDPALKLNSFRRQLKTFLFARYNRHNVH